MYLQRHTRYHAVYVVATIEATLQDRELSPSNLLHPEKNKI